MPAAGVGLKLAGDAFAKMMKSSKNEEKTGVIEANAVLKAIDFVRKKNRGQYLKNIAEVFASELV